MQLTPNFKGFFMYFILTSTINVKSYILFVLKIKCQSNFEILSIFYGILKRTEL